MAKRRTEIPYEVAARVLFQHDRTCCVCKQRGKPVQIHHADENPKNHHPRNLAVLCFDCHRETQIRGGFDRKLDGEQVLLYRDDWLRSVARNRALEEVKIDQANRESTSEIEWVTSLAEIYRENNEYELLAAHYAATGNNELRDKYIEFALKEPASDDSICFLRGLQDRHDLIPGDVVERKLRHHHNRKDYEQEGRLFAEVKRYPEAAFSYTRGILEALKGGRVFSAAFYLKEILVEGIPARLFEIALRDAREAGDLWWQVRALQELGWQAELNQLLLNNEQAVGGSGNLHLEILLAIAKGEREKVLCLEKELAHQTHCESGVILHGEEPVKARFSCCPYCNREAKQALSSNWFPIYECLDCGTRYCENDGPPCPECGSNHRGQCGKVYA